MRVLFGCLCQSRGKIHVCAVAVAPPVVVVSLSPSTEHAYRGVHIICYVGIIVGACSCSACAHKGRAACIGMFVVHREGKVLRHRRACVCGSINSRISFRFKQAACRRAAAGACARTRSLLASMSTSHGTVNASVRRVNTRTCVCVCGCVACQFNPCALGVIVI